MSFPPPPHNAQPSPEQGGGFGPPPQGFGPPPPPGDGFGPPPSDNGYGYPPQGGAFPGGAFPPPQPPRNNTKRNVWIAVGSVAAVGAIVAATALSGDDDKSSAKDAPKVPPLTALPTVPTIPMPSFTLPTDFPSLDLPTDLPSISSEPEPSSPDTQQMPYVVVDPGKCFNVPTMTHTITTIQTVPCSSAHDAQAISDKTLPDALTTEDEIEKKAFSLCEADATEHAPADGDYYSYVLFPELDTYKIQGRRTATCSLTKNDGTNGKKLLSKLS